MRCSGRTISSTAALALLLSVLSAATRAQAPPATNTTSTPAAGAHDYLQSAVDIVNPANGSVSVRIPVRMPSGRQLTVPFSFAYDSNGAFYIGPGPTGGAPRYETIPTSVNQKGGWTYSYPALSFQSGTWSIPNNSDGSITCHGSFNYVFQDPGGNRHNLGLSVSADVAGGDGENCSDGLSGDGVKPTGGEGPIAALTSIPGTNNGVFPSTSVTDGNGTVYSFSSGAANTYLATSVADRNSNTVTISNSSGAITYTDTIGRTALHTSGLGGNPDTVTLAGLSLPYKTYWTTASANFTDNMLNECTGAGCGTCPTSLSQSSSVISSIVLPNGKQFTFTYDPTYGMLTKIVYPTGGYVRYVWGLNSHSDQGQSWYTSGGTTTYWNCRYDFPAITDRYVSFNGSTEVLHQHFAYSTTWGASAWTTKQTTVTTYDLVSSTNFTTQYTYSPLAAQYVPNCPLCYMSKQTPTEQTIQNYDTTGALLRTITKSWTSIRTMSSQQTKLDNGQSSLVVYCYGPNEQVTETDEYDLGTTSPSPAPCTTTPTGTQAGALIRKTTTSYAAFAAHIVDLPATVISYDGSGNRVAETDTYYDQTGITNRGNPTTITKQCFILPGSSACPQGNSTTTFTYDSSGQMLTMKDPRANQTSYSYTDSYSTCGGSAPPASPSDAYLSQITYPPTNGISHIVKNCYDYTSGLLLSSTDQNNLVTSYKYVDTLDRLTETDFPDGGKTTLAYNDTPPSPTVTTSKKINSASLTLTAVAVSDGLGHVTRSQLTSDPQGTILTDIAYDGLGRVYSASNPYRSGTDPTSSPGTTHYTYDAVGRKRTTTYPDNSVLNSVYCGPETLVTDPVGKWRRSRADGLGRLVEVDEPNSTSATVASTGCPGTGEPIWVTSYTYDALSDLTSVLQNGSHQRSFAYDSLGRLSTSSNPEVGTLTYTYDTAGNISTKKDARTITATYSYDALNRSTGRTYSNGDPAVTITYDQPNCLGLSACQNIGHATSTTDAAGSETWAYQVDGATQRNVHINQRTIGTITKTSTYYLDLAGNLTQIIYPTGRTVNYSYDAADRPSSAADASNGVTYASDFQAAPTGCLSGKVCYTPEGSFYALSIGQTSSFTGLNLTHTYNSRLQPLEFKASSTGGNAIDISYGFVDPLTVKNSGHVYGITNNLDSTRSQTFGYDQLNRIVSAQTTSTHGTSPAHCWGEVYSLDAWTNLSSIAATTNSNYTGCSQESGFSRTPDGNNHLSGLGYDSAGNTSGDGVNAYTWDAESQLKTAAGTTYTYDGAGRRVSKVGSKLYWYGSGGEILAETNSSGTTSAEYIFFGGKRIAMLPAGGNPTYYIEDLLGTSRVLTSNTGVACYDADFYPYGGERVYTNSCPQNYKFEGKERDTETGNDDFGARYYSNRLGRWLSADWSSIPAPIPYANLSNPQTLNLYSMVADDPESFADLDGHLGHNCFDGCTEAGGQAGVNLAHCSPAGFNSDACETAAEASAEQTQMQAQQQAQQAANQQSSQAQETTAAVQLVKDEAIGIAKEVANTVIGVTNLVDNGINALLGSNLQTPEFKPSTPGEKAAMAGTSLALLLVPESKTADAIKLGKSLASEAQMAAKGEAIFGAGAKKALNQAGRLSAEYGGKPGEWAKMTSKAYRAGDGSVISTHWYENATRGIKAEFKSIIDSAPWNK